MSEEATPRNRYEQLKRQVVEFHRGHPEVLDLFSKFALELIEAQGRKRVGGAAIWERMRWETMVNPDYQEEGEWKLNNNFHPFYVRAFIARYPEYKDRFQLRTQISKRGAVK